MMFAFVPDKPNFDEVYNKEQIKKIWSYLSERGKINVPPKILSNLWHKWILDKVSEEQSCDTTDDNLELFAEWLAYQEAKEVNIYENRRKK